VRASTAGPDDADLARAALTATRAIPGVSDISRGRYTVARAFGRRGNVVEGVQFTPEAQGLRVELHVAVRLVPIPPLAQAIRSAVAKVLARQGVFVSAVDVWVDALRTAEAEEECE
jgi:hypothetical protein